MTIRLLEGHVLDVLSREPAGSVHCAVTSPPYLWLRAYGTEPQVWGPADCEHQWGAPEEMSGPGKRGDTKVRWQHTGTGQSGHERWSSYFCARCGAWRGELGQEPSVELYVSHLVAVMGAVGRVLRDDGTLWVNLAGCYFNDPGGQNGGGAPSTSSTLGATDHSVPGESARRYGLKAFGPERVSGKAMEANRQNGRQKRGRHPWLKALDWVDVPGLFAHAMQAAGWLWRSDITWVKPSALPESVSGTRFERCKGEKVKAGATKPGYGGATKLADPTAQYGVGRAEKAEWADCPGCPRCAATQGYVLRRGNGRPTKSTEHVLFFAKKPGYFFDTEAVREAFSENSHTGYALVATKAARSGMPGNTNGMGASTLGTNAARGHGSPNAGRNLRDWWVLSPEPLKDEHYAAYPTTLPTRCIKAGTSERGCCPGCGAPWARVVEREQAGVQTHRQEHLTRAQVERTGGVKSGGITSSTFGVPADEMPVTTTLGWRPTCRCPTHEPVPCRVLDPFAGSGTTLIAADRLGRDAVGVELKPQYVAMAQRRVVGDAPLLLWGAVTVEQPVEADTTGSVPEAVPLLLEEPEDARPLHCGAPGRAAGDEGAAQRLRLGAPAQGLGAGHPLPRGDPVHRAGAGLPPRRRPAPGAGRGPAAAHGGVLDGREGLHRGPAARAGWRLRTSL
jgi:DNA modification methylase